MEASSVGGGRAGLQGRVHRRSGGKGVCPLGEQRPIVKGWGGVFLKEKLCEIDSYLIAHKSPA